MLKGLLAICGGVAAALLLAVPGMAYQGSSGASVTTCSSTVPPGGSTCVVATFTTNGQPNQGDNVVFSQRNGGGNGCTVSFSPASGTTDQSGQATSNATIGSSCRGTVDLCATDTTTNQGACASVLVQNGNGNGNGGGNGNGNGGGNGSTGNGGGHGNGNGGSKPAGSRTAIKNAGAVIHPGVIGGATAGLLLVLAGALAILLRRRSSKTIV